MIENDNPLGQNPGGAPANGPSNQDAAKQEAQNRFGAAPEGGQNQNGPQAMQGGGWTASAPRDPYTEQQGQHYSYPQRPYDTPRQQQPWGGGTPNQYSSATGWGETGAPKADKYEWNFSDYQAAGAAKPKQKKKGLAVFAVILAGLVTVAAVSAASIGIYQSVAGSKAPSADPPAVTAPANLPGMQLQDKPQEEAQALPGGKLSTEDIVEKVEPSIVAITTYVNYAQNGIQSFQPVGMGSGIIMQADGYIVTNAHVVANSGGISVQLYNGESYEGRIVGADSKTDLAVIKIDAAGLQAATFGNSDQVKVGEKVLAIGNPQSMAFTGTVTQGIVSGLNRKITASSGDGSAPTNYSNLIQTDAAINPGNSGGALVNEYGQVIGINSAKVMNNGVEGLGFAIPANEAQPIVDDLIAHGRVTGRVLLGITAVQIDEVLARLNNVPVGIQVRSTQEGSDISTKGVIPGDIITKINGQDITSMQVVSDELEGKKPGDSVELEVYRRDSMGSGRFFNVNIQLVEDMGDQPVENTPEQTPAPQEQEDYPSIEDFFRDYFG